MTTTTNPTTLRTSCMKKTSAPKSSKTWDSTSWHSPTTTADSLTHPGASDLPAAPGVPIGTSTRLTTWRATDREDNPSMLSTNKEIPALVPSASRGVDGTPWRPASIRQMSTATARNGTFSSAIPSTSFPLRSLPKTPSLIATSTWITSTASTRSTITEGKASKTPRASTPRRKGKTLAPTRMTRPVTQDIGPTCTVLQRRKPTAQPGYFDPWGLCSTGILCSLFLLQHVAGAFVPWNLIHTSLVRTKMIPRNHA
mmetsp:Transcript_21537/g.51404  ORF Transcript_21537/g.51404 Transcript_21537/m.51404 type:complete len:255 (-) Transcript_21537:767-1531(-)